MLTVLVLAAFSGPALAEIEAAPPSVRFERLSADQVAALAAEMIDAGRYDAAQALLDQLAEDGTGGLEREFLAGMVALARKDYATAERQFHKILSIDPSLVRVRLELARILFLQRKDEQADYHFRLAIAQRPPEAVVDNVARFRQAIRARRSWRFNLNLAIAPDTNVNAATNKEGVDLYGIPFRLNENARAQSGVGKILGGDASVRLRRHSKVPFYLALYGRAALYGNRDYNDIYVGGELGPEFQVSGGRLRTTATLFRRWYGDRKLATSQGTRVHFDKIVGGKLGIDASIAARREDYTRRNDLDAWNIEATANANKAISASAVGFAYGAVQWSSAKDTGYSYLLARAGAGVVKEVVWGLRPQLAFELGRQWNLARLVQFNRTRRDWALRATASIYKRDWNISGFAPSFRLSWTRNFSTIALYDQKRLRAEIGLTKAF